jgi:hypothetical protein
VGWGGGGGGDDDVCVCVGDYWFFVVRVPRETSDSLRKRILFVGAHASHTRLTFSVKLYNFARARESTDTAT